MSHLVHAVRNLRRLGTDVIYIDKQLILINKASGVVSQPTVSNDPAKQVRSPSPSVAVILCSIQ